MIIAIFCFVISGFTLWYAGKLTKLYFKVKTWLKVEATIISKEKVIQEGRFYSVNSPFTVKANYTYVLNSEVYTNTAVYLVELIGGTTNHMSANAYKTLEKIKTGMLVYVNPKKPTESVLFCSGIGLYLMVLVMGFIAFLFGLGNLINAL